VQQQALKRMSADSTRMTINGYMHILGASNASMKAEVHLRVVSLWFATQQYM